MSFTPHLSVAYLLLALGFASSARANEEFPKEWFGHTDDAQWKDRVNLTGKTPPRLTVAHWMNGELSQGGVRGKIVVLDFWATWCGPCLALVPENNKLYEKHKAAGVVVIGVCSSTGQERMEQLAKQRLIRYPIARDPESRSAQAWLVGWWPTYAVVDRKGKLRALGVASNHVEDVVKKLLEEQPLPKDPEAAGDGSGVWLFTEDATQTEGNTAAPAEDPRDAVKIPNEETLLPFDDITLKQVREQLRPHYPEVLQELGEPVMEDLEKLVFNELRWLLRRDGAAYKEGVNRNNVLTGRELLTTDLAPDELNAHYYMHFGGDVKRVGFQAKPIEVELSVGRDILEEGQVKRWAERESTRVLLDREFTLVTLKLVDRAVHVQPPYPGPYREVTLRLVRTEARPEAGFVVVRTTRSRVDSPETEVSRLVGVDPQSLPKAKP